MLYNNVSKFVSQLKIGYHNRFIYIDVEPSKLLYVILKILSYEGYIIGFKGGINKTRVFLKYKKGKPIINNIFSYTNSNNIKSFMSYEELKKHYGYRKFAIISTNKGLLSNKECLLYGLGGKILLEIK